MAQVALAATSFLAFSAFLWVLCSFGEYACLVSVRAPKPALGLGLLRLAFILLCFLFYTYCY